MSWSIGYDPRWKRDVGYGVPAYCDHPGCMAEIDRGLSFVCGGEPYGGERGCGLYFCGKHHNYGSPSNLCARCGKNKPPFTASKENPEWINFKLTDESWKEWRKNNPSEVQKLNL